MELVSSTNDALFFLPAEVAPSRNIEEEATDLDTSPSFDSQSPLFPFRT